MGKLTDKISNFIKYISTYRWINALLLLIFIALATYILTFDFVGQQWELGDITFYFMRIIIAIGLCLTAALFLLEKISKNIFDILKVYVVGCTALVTAFYIDIQETNPQRVLLDTVNVGEGLIFKMFLTLSLFIICYFIKVVMSKST